MLRIAHIMAFSEGSDGSTFSGAENHLFALSVAQAARGHHVTIYALVGQPGMTLDAQADRLRDAGVRWVAVGPTKPHRALARRALRALASPRLVSLLRRDRPDVVHVHMTLASQVGRVAALLAGCRTVVESTHCDEPEYLRTGLNLRLRTLDRVTSRHIAISAHVKDHLIRVLGICPDRIEVVHYGVEMPANEPSRRELRRSLDLHEDDFVVGFVGRLAPQKNVDVFIDAVSRLTDVQGLVVGSGPLERSLRSQASERRAKVQFLGFRSDAGSLIGALDALCLPSGWEGLGLVLLEAMARGVPTIGSRAGAIPEILGEGRYGYLVPVGDAEALADAIEAVRQDPARAKRIAAEAYDRVARDFTIEAMTKATDACYLSALAAR